MRGSAKKTGIATKAAGIRRDLFNVIFWFVLAETLFYCLLYSLLMTSVFRMSCPQTCPYKREILGYRTGIPCFHILSHNFHKSLLIRGWYLVTHFHNSWYIFPSRLGNEDRAVYRSIPGSLTRCHAYAPIELSHIPLPRYKDQAVLWFLSSCTVSPAFLIQKYNSIITWHLYNRIYWNSQGIMYSFDMVQLPVFQDRFNVEFKSGVSVDIIE